MNDNLMMIIQDRVFSGLGKKNGNFLLLKHYNTLVLNEEKKAQIERAYSEALRGLGECHRQEKNESGSPLPLLAALWKQYSFLMM